MRFLGSVVAIVAALGLAACGSGSGSASGSGSGSGSGASAGSRTSTDAGLGLRAHPQAVQPEAGSSAQYYADAGGTPVGDPNARAPSLAEVRRELKVEQRIAQTLNALE